MNRIDRLTAILILLQTKRVVKASEIADRFSISIRTVYRDIRALEEAGVPIGAQAGTGYFLVEGYHLPPVMFTKDEAGALLTGGKLIDTFSDYSIKNNFTAALDKIKSVLDTSQKVYLENLDDRMTVLSMRHQTDANSHSNLLTKIQMVLGTNRVIYIDYHSGYKDEITHRPVEPLGLCFYADNWHLLAFCRLRSDYRDFRVDRIKRVKESKEIFDEKHKPSLQSLIDKIVIAEDLKTAVVRFEETTARIVRDHKYYFGFIDEKMKAGCIEMRFLTPSYSYLAKWLLAFIENVTVLSPKELKIKLQEYSKRLFEHYNQN